MNRDDEGSSPDLIVLPSQPFILDLCSSSDDDNNSEDYHDYNIGQSNRRSLDSSDNYASYTPPSKKRRINQEESDPQQSESDDNNSDSESSNHEEDEDSDIETTDDLTRLITRARVYNQSDKRSIDRADEYISDFDSCYRTKHCIFGTIEGRSTWQDYRVKIFITNGNRLGGSCSCPSWHHWCKHLVALGITFVESSDQFEEKNDDQDSDVDGVGFLLSRRQIHAFTDDISFERASGYVGDFDEYTKDQNGISGTVVGRSTNEEYAVSIEVNEEQQLEGSCSCPSYHHWCKHIAALGLTYIEYPDQFDSD